MLNISHYDRMIESNERKREGERERGIKIQKG